MRELDHTTVIILTLNAGRYLERLIPALAEQGFDRSQFLVMDSSSTDGTAEAFRKFGAQVENVARSDFDHGTTRKIAAGLRPQSSFYIYLTQDALPASPDAFRNLLASFGDEKVGIAYGRQLPREVADPIEQHARLRNYPDRSETRGWDGGEKPSIKTVFNSNSFAAYRRSALEEVGNFPENALFAEDQIVSAREVLAGWRVRYCAEARVIHSHGYTLKEEFKRYFDVGTFHAQNSWILEKFGAAEGEGLRFIKSEISFLASRSPLLIPESITRTFLKYLGYRLGRHHRALPRSLKAQLSMHGYHWRK